MIHYSLTCAKGHEFDGWFQSAAEYDRQAAGGLLRCALCGSRDVTKALMAPGVHISGNAVTRPLAEGVKPDRKALEEALAALRRDVEENSEYVGLSFAEEARAIHEGTSPRRSIYGEANREDAKSLIEEGVPVAPLPFIPHRRVN
jgi:hypothetical protein